MIQKMMVDTNSLALDVPTGRSRHGVSFIASQISNTGIN